MHKGLWINKYLYTLVFYQLIKLSFFICVVEGVGEAVASASLDAETKKGALALLEEELNPLGGGLGKAESLAAEAGTDLLGRRR